MADSRGSGTITQDDIDSLLSEIEQEQTGGAPGAPGAKGAEPTILKAEEFLNEPVAHKPAARHAPPPRPTLPPDAPRDLEFLMDIPLQVAVEVGRTRMTIGDLLTLGPGSLVELDKLAGEPLEIYINRKLVARGEAVIVNEKFGVRLTDVISKVERLANLKA